MPRVRTASVGEFYQHYPKVAAILTVNAGGKKNAMAAAWHSAISYKPPLYGVAVSPKRYTYKLIVESGEFGINFMPFEAAELIASVGGSGGSEMDKFRKFNVAEEKPLKTTVPILREAYAAYECKLVDNKTYGDHAWMVGEIVAVHFTDDLFTDKGTLDVSKLNPALYLGAELYITAKRESVRLLDRETYGRR
ncbi:MAG: flavin reductase family protein [Dehalococcoidia bacterium]|jgi:flavin reductase (DIM6/NTAB) family NADH-FMN oxidoreductase RutF